MSFPVVILWLLRRELQNKMQLLKLIVIVRHQLYRSNNEAMKVKVLPLNGVRQGLLNILPVGGVSTGHSGENDIREDTVISKKPRFGNPL